MSTPALILLSGGLDSATCLAIAADNGHAPLHTIAFDYGQRHRHELRAAEQIAEKYGAKHRVVRLDLRQFGGSALTADIDVPKHDRAADIGTDIPVTYVPARNTLFLSYALAECEVSGINDIYIGVNALDYSGYPDCRSEFIDAFQQAARLGTKLTALSIHTPLIHWTKAQIICEGVNLGVDYAQTHSCYDPVDGLACGRCDSCLLRAKGFADAGVPDPTRYVQR